MAEATHKKNFKPIAIKDLFMDKNPKLAPWIPGFVYRFLSRMIRIDVFNVTLEVLGKKYLPAEGRFIFVSNHVSGRCSNFFYKLEMFFLPNESYKHRNKHFVITFGKPIPYRTFDKRFSPVQWSARVKDYSYSLVENPEGEFSDINN